MPGCFPVLGERTSPVPLKSDLLSWCPTMDLLASVTDTDEIHLHRSDGVRVWISSAADLRTTASITCIAWRPDGKVLVLSFNDGTIRFISVNDGKLVGAVPDASAAREAEGSHHFLHWVEGHIAHGRRDPSLAVDIRRELPHLPPLLSASAADEHTFTSKNAVESMIHDLENSTEHISLIVACQASRYFRFILGALEVDLDSNIPADASIIHFACSSDLREHAVLYSTSTGLWLSLYRMPAFLSPDSMINDLVRKYNDYHAVSCYLTESLSCVQEEWAVVQDTRRASYSSLLDSSVTEGNQMEGHTEKEKHDSARHSLYSLLLTGVPDDVTAAWLKDEISMRVVKRWEKMCIASLKSMRTIIFESSLPACERLVILLESLLQTTQLAGSHDADIANIDALSQLKTEILFLMAQLHSMIKDLTTETTTFAAFCGWLSFTLDRFSEDDEHPDTPMPVSITKVVEYIKHHFPRSRIASYFEKEINPVPQTAVFPGLLDPEALHAPLQNSLRRMEDASREFFAKPVQLLKSQWQHIDSVLLCSSASRTAGKIFLRPGRDQAIVAECLFAQNPEDDRLPSSVSQARVSLQGQKLAAEVNVVALAEDEVGKLRIEDMLQTRSNEVLILAKICGDSRQSILLSHSSSSSHVDASQMDIQAATRFRTLPQGQHAISMSVSGRAGRRKGCYLLADRQRLTVFDLDGEGNEQST